VTVPRIFDGGMKVLFIGGTGIISTACVELAVARGIGVAVLNRGLREGIPGVSQLVADINEPTAAASALAGATWDVVVDFICFTSAQVEQRLALFKDRVGQFIFISSASVYQKPAAHWLISESTPLVNPYWDYSRDKIGCEERLLRALREDGFPAVIVRPSFTYGDTVVPLTLNSWPRTFTAVDRMRHGKPVIIPGDGLTLWTMTHNSDFAKALVGLLGHQSAIGHAFHITSDEVLTWNQIYGAVAEAAGVPLKAIHISSDFITACVPDAAGSLLGDKANCAVFDNSKIKRFVPDYVATTRFRDGIKRTIAWFDADRRRQEIDEEASAKWDKLIEAYQRGLDAARREFGR
jgi:nucleoside-diphosphate-sugar epimerase